MSPSNNQNVTSDTASEYTLFDKDNVSIYSKTETLTEATSSDTKEKKSLFDRLRPSSKSSSSSSSSAPKPKKNIPKQDPIKNWEARVCASTFR